MGQTNGLSYVRIILHVFFRNLTDELRKIDKVLGLPSILSFFATSLDGFMSSTYNSRSILKNKYI